MAVSRAPVLAIAVSMAALLGCASQSSGAPPAADEAQRYVAALRAAAAKEHPAAGAIRLRPTRGGPRGERIGRGWPEALRDQIRDLSGNRPHVRFGGAAAKRGELDLVASTFGKHGSEWFLRLAAFAGDRRRWSSEVRVVRRNGRWVGILH